MPPLGRTYDVRPRSCVRNPVATWQYGLTGVTAELIRPAPNALVPVTAVDSSGRSARTSQLSETVCPLLVPPTIVSPPAVLRLSVTSRPLKYCSHFPYVLEPVTRLSTCPAFSGTTS